MHTCQYTCQYLCILAAQYTCAYLSMIDWTCAYLSMIDWNFLKSCSSMFGLNDPLFTTGYQMTPSLAGFFYPNDPTFIALGTEWPGFYSGCLLNDPIFWRVHILPDRPLLLTWSRHIPVTSDRECPPGIILVIRWRGGIIYRILLTLSL